MEGLAPLARLGVEPNRSFSVLPLSARARPDLVGDLSGEELKTSGVLGRE